MAKPWLARFLSALGGKTLFVFLLFQIAVPASFGDGKEPANPTATPTPAFPLQCELEGDCVKTVNLEVLFLPVPGGSGCPPDADTILRYAIVNPLGKAGDCDPVVCDEIFAATLACGEVATNGDCSDAQSTFVHLLAQRLNEAAELALGPGQFCANVSVPKNNPFIQISATFAFDCCISSLEFGLPAGLAYPLPPGCKVANICNGIVGDEQNLFVSGFLLRKSLGECPGAPTPTSTNTVEPTSTATPTPDQTEAASPTPTEDTAATSTPTSTSTSAASPTPSPTGTLTGPTATATETPGGPTATPTTEAATSTPTPEIFETATATPTGTLSSPTPTETATQGPEETPSASPTPSPTSAASETATPTGLGTETPTSTPFASGSPTSTPTVDPSVSPSATATPSVDPSISPTATATPDLSASPTATQTPDGSETPTATPDGPPETPVATQTPTNPPVCDSGYYVLDSLGGRHRVGNPISIMGSVYFGFDIARDLERAVCDIGGATHEDLVVLDGYGAAHFVQNPACDIMQTFYFGDVKTREFFPQGRALDVEISADSQGLWTLTDFGGIYRAGSTKDPSEEALLPNTDLTGVLGFDVPLTGDFRDPNLPDPGGATLRAVAFVIIDVDRNSRAEGYVVLNSMGGRVHLNPDGTEVSPGTYAAVPDDHPTKLLDPAAYVWPFFSGLDIARDMELHPTQQGVVILDGWDGIHPVPVDRITNPVYFARNDMSLVDPTPVQEVGMPYVVMGYDDPSTPEDESDSNLFGIDATSIFRDLEFSAGCGNGLYTMEAFGGVFVMGPARPIDAEPVPQFGGSPYFFPFLYAEAIEIFAADEAE